MKRSPLLLVCSGLAILAGSFSFVGSAQAVTLLSEDFEGVANVFGSGTYNYSLNYTMPNLLAPAGGLQYMKGGAGIGGSASTNIFTATGSPLSLLTGGITGGQIDGGQVSYNLYAQFSSYLFQGDYSTLTVQFLDAGNSPVGSLLAIGGSAFASLLGSGNNGSYTNARDWGADSLAGIVPSGARTAKVQVLAAKVPTATAIDGYMDNVNISISVTNPTAAINLDGSLDAGYGAAKAVQTVETGFADNFSELDAGYAVVQAGNLYIMLTGNLEANFNKLNIFIDSKAGGQNQLNLSNPVNGNWANKYNGFRFDPGFTADYVFILRHGGSQFDFDYSVIGGGPNAFDSYGSVFGDATSGAATTGVGPNLGFSFGIACNNSNVAGVLGGIGPANQTAALAVRTGIELRIPLAALGNPSVGGTIRICAMVNASTNDYLSNQFLGGLAAPQGNLGGDGNGGFNGSVGAIDLNNFAGDQFFVVTVTEPIPPVLLMPPQSQIVPAGSNAIFTVIASSTGQLFYQWRFNGVSISGATNTSLSLTNVQLTNAGSYSVVVTNTYGSVTSAVASLVVYLPASPPIIVTQPTSQFAQVGTNATFAVTAAGPTPLKYQWRFNGSPLTARTNTSLSLTNVQLTNRGGYSVVVTNAYGSVTSAIAELMFLVQTNRTPTTEIVSVSSGISGLKMFTNGTFVPSIQLNPNQMTIVLTHGFDSNPDAWATNLAIQLKAHVPGLSANIVAWDWRDEAAGPELIKVFPNSRKCKKQGEALGEAMINRLGTNYSQPVHFVGHSLGTLVNSAAANYLHKDITPWSLLGRPSTSIGAYQHGNTHMTLFDEAELVPEAVNYVLSAVLARLLNSPISVKPFYDRPLPKQSGYADSYLSLAGLFHDEAVNCVLTNGFGAIDSATSYPALFDALVDFHSYPCGWYAGSVTNPFSSLVGNKWSFERGGFVGAPSIGSVYVQSYAGSPLNVAIGNELSVMTNYVARLSSISRALGFNLLQSVRNGVAEIRGTVEASIQDVLTHDPYSQTTGQANASMIVNLFTRSGGSSLTAGSGPHPLGGGSGSENLPAYAWLPLVVPLDAVSMSFDFTLQGDGKADRFAAALNGTNVFSLETGLIETNVTMNSGLIDVSPYAGQQVELFLGIVGGTSTNANVIVSSIRFYSLIAPSLQIQILGTNAVVTWPLFGTGYFLQSTTNLTATSSWSDVTNQPVIANLQYTVTNGLSAGSRFYRLSKFSSGSPALQARVAGGNIVVSWPTSTTSYTLEATTNLTAPDSWTTVTNVPAFVDFQTMVTNPITTGSRFYRLKK